MMRMVKNEFDGSLELISDSKLELNAQVSVVNLKGETVSRYVVELKQQPGPANDFVWIYSFSAKSPAQRAAEKRERMEA